MRHEGKNFFDTQSILHRRKVLIGAVGVVATAGITGVHLGRPRAVQTSATLDVLSEPEQIMPSRFLLDKHAAGLREAHREAQLWHDTTIVVFGADLKDGRPQFKTEEAVTAIRRRNPRAECISGLGTDERNGVVPASKDSLITTKERILSMIRNNHGTPTTILFTAHGGPLGIQLGTYVNAETGQQERIHITPEELAHAYAPKYRSMRSRMLARQSPDILAFVNCSSGNIAGEFMTELQRAEREREPRRDLRSFQPTTPITFSASTAEEVSYINQLLFEMTEHTTVGGMYASADRIGGRQFSNPGIRVPDTETGVPVVVGANDSGTRFA
ncbi:hypothetical protein K2P56_03115 [Patescibacteria group bacterium]|nr:hypothetical protein [Patescibacteria group bacterium]